MNDDKQHHEDIERMVKIIQDMEPSYAVNHSYFGRWVTVDISLIHKGKRMGLDIVSGANPMIALGVLQGIHAALLVQKHMEEK